MAYRPVLDCAQALHICYFIQIKLHPTSGRTLVKCTHTSIYYTLHISVRLNMEKWLFKYSLLPLHPNAPCHPYLNSVAECKWFAFTRLVPCSGWKQYLCINQRFTGLKCQHRHAENTAKLCSGGCIFQGKANIEIRMKQTGFSQTEEGEV